MKRLEIVACVFILISLVAESHATVTQITEREKCPESYAGCYKISGVITQKDSKEIGQIADRIVASRNRNSIFQLDSAGGDVEAAIKIGRELRSLGAMAAVLEDATCASSCVFVLAGATTRVAAGQIGIHRPYSLRTDLRDYNSIQTEQRKLSRMAKEYLEEMNVTPQLYDAMMRVNSEKIRILSSRGC